MGLARPDGRGRGGGGAVSRLSHEIYGDFVQPVLDCGQAAAEGLDSCDGLFFFSVQERWGAGRREHTALNCHYTAFKHPVQ